MSQLSTVSNDAHHLSRSSLRALELEYQADAWHHSSMQ
eukprot:CAMPEP_0115304452 /NCGR_PEP_ID=MMETSP0270-20121206/71474_1 /TAXON_ID=71861 /ORGANISM="Scrippsiella trochoidea, Strain CCMP3099" /LENGTH=37 /DNA_ID= /DNA_START= /DNA_END= /DNA_ORIENTATION=